MVGALLAGLRIFPLMEEAGARYLREAKTCLEEAEKATRAADKKAWLKLAEEWMVMAQKIQRQTPREN